MKKIYLSGKMTGVENLNYPAFEQVAKELRAKGFEVFSPHENDARYGLDPSKPVSREMRKKLIRDDLNFILTDCDEVWVLPNWHGSKGVAAEIATAKAVGVKVVYMRGNGSGLD